MTGAANTYPTGLIAFASAGEEDRPMADPDLAALREAVLESLRMVIDPELGENLVDLGLIYRLDVAAGVLVRIEMSTTTKGCPAAAYLKDAVHSAAWIVPGIEKVDVALVYDPPWSPEMISSAVAKRFRGAGRGGPQ